MLHTIFQIIKGIDKFKKIINLCLFKTHTYYKNTFLYCKIKKQCQKINHS